MKRIGSIFIVLLIFCGAISAQSSLENFANRWWYAYLEEAALPLNITFAKSDAGAISLELYSPMQSSDPMIPSSWSFENDTLLISHKQLGLKMTLVWNEEDSSFAGMFRQGLLRTVLRFTPAEGMFKIVRPQTPQPPFPYRGKEVTVERKKAGVRLSGTLTLPNDSGKKFPAVVLVSGSGQQNRDEEIMGHKPFLVIADWLTRNGIAVLRYDDREVGGSKGPLKTATTLDFADDAEAMFDYLYHCKEIDPKRVGIIGHSEGAEIASIIASRNKKVGFIVMLGGPGTTGADILMQQSGLILELNGVPHRLAERHVEAMRDFFGVMDSAQPADYEKLFIAVCEKHSEDLTKEERKQAALGKADAMAMASQMAIPWMQTFVKLDNRDYLKKVKCPILAVGGSKDCQVVPSNLDAIKSATGGKAEIRLMEGLNHLMQHCTTGAPNEYMLIQETVAQEVLDCIIDWLGRIKK